MGRGEGCTSASDKNNSTSIWIPITMIKYDVASITMVFNKEEGWMVTALEYANHIIMENADTSDTTRHEQLKIARRGLNNSLNPTATACGMICRRNGPSAVHCSNGSSGMSGSGTANVLHELRMRERYGQRAYY